MKVAIDHHFPFLLAHGGFQIQIEQTRLALKHLGVDVKWLQFWNETEVPDIIHFFGTVHADYLRFAKGKGIKTVISELHTSLGSRPDRKHRLQSAVIQITRTMAPQFAMRMNWDRFAEADAVVALTPYEADLMCNVFHAPRSRMHVIPNGVDKVFLEPSSVAREDWLLCTAVIHPRKRVVELAKAAVIAKTPLRVYGRPYSENDAYFHVFCEVVASSGGLVRWEGSLSDRSVLADIYRRARGFVLPSTMESLSLSALEAAAALCPLLLTDLPWATSTFASYASYVKNSSDPAVIAQAVAQFYSEPKPPTGYNVHSWQAIAHKLRTLYSNLLASS